MNTVYPNQALDRLVRLNPSRASAMLGQRPLPPRPTSLVAGLLAWEEPKQTANISHYKIYLGHGVLFAKVAVGTTKVTGFTGTKAFITSFDERTESESFERTVSGTAASGGGSGSAGATATDYHTISGSFTIHASVMPAPTNGLLIVSLTMASGAVQPTWSSDFSKAPGAISALVGSKTNCIFGSDGSGKWMLVAPPAG